MRAFMGALVVAIAMLVSSNGAAVEPANPRTIAGFDHIKPPAIGKVLTQFCHANGCTAKLTWGNAVWHFFVDGKEIPVAVGKGCAGIPHRYCVQTTGSLARAFMTPARTQQLKQMLEAKGARVVLMDCSVEQTEHGLDYVCADGKPPK